MAKVLYVSSVDEKKKAGHFNAVFDRVSELQKSGVDVVSVNYSSNFKSSCFDISIWKPWFLGQVSILKYFENIYLFFSLYWVLVKVRPEIIHVHWAYPIGYCCSLVSRMLGIRLVMTVHGSDIHSNPKKSAYIKKCTIHALNHVSQVLCVSNSLAREVAELKGGSERVIVTPNFIDVDYLGNVEGVVHKEDSVLRIGFIGNLEEVKGADLLPGIMDEIRAKIDCVDFHVAGSGSYLPMLVKELPFVKFYGHVERRKALEIMRSMDVIIFPSKKEGFGLVPLESLFLGIPCVAYNIDGLQDVFAGNEELLCANMNATSYADLVVSVLKEGKKPRLQEIQKYSKEVCMRKERALYDRLLEGVE